MQTKLAWQGLGLLLFRVGVSALMLFYHGWEKVVLLFSGDEIDFFDPIGIGVMFSFVLAALAEFLGSIFIALGLWTRWVSAVLAINMFVAAIIHFDDTSLAEVPKQLATLFLLSYMLLIFFGAGRFSLDKLVRKRN